MTPPRVAVVGLACRYPDADGPGRLWENVLAGRRAFRRLPPARLAGAYRGDQPDLTYATHAAVLRDWSFDRAAFGIPGPLHRAADHAHWLALETAAAVLADAGVPGGEGLDRDTAGVVIGNSLTGEFSRAGLLRLRWPFVADAAATALRGAGVGEEASAEVLRRMRALVKSPFPVPGDETLAGALANTIAGRVCNHFDFHGTGYTVDGACSSSLLAVITACRALVEGDLDFAVAGGVDLSLDPLELVGFARLGALARGDRMRVFDAEPTGFLPGEGCGMVALVRAEDAERLGLRVYAHLVGWGTSSDGAGGLTRPETAGQELAMRRAYLRARVDPADVGLVEGHGTGTPVGDRVELEALVRLRGATAPEAALGSVKANIGHTKAAAGVAGLIKAVQAVHHRVLPPTTGCERPHELLRDSPLRVLPEAEPWTDPLPRAAVSSMGFGGINAHVVVEAAVRRRTAAALSAATRRWAARAPGPEVVVLAAADRRELVARLDRLAAVAGSFSEAEVRDAAGTAWRDLRPGGHRAALVARTPAGLADAAAAAALAASDWDGEVVLDRRAGFALGTAGGRVGLLFPGQAAPVRLALPEWAERLDVPALPSALGGRDGDVDTAVAQPAVVRQSMAALAWLEEAGCVPVGAVGHSLGEIAALCWAGALTPAAAVDLAAARGRVMAGHAVPDTGMASLDCALGTAAALVANTPVVVAAHNAPDRVVVAGERAAVAEVLRRARAGGVTGAVLPVSHGFHSPAMVPARAPLRAVLAEVPLDRPDRPVFSTVTGDVLDPDADLRDLLVRQLTEPVRFTSALARLAERCDLLVEAGPGTVLSGLAAGCGTPAVALDVGGDEVAHAFAAAALAAVAGADPGPWFADRPFRPIPLDAEPAVLANPCEDRSGWDDAVRAAETDAVGTDATGVAAPEPVAVADGDPFTVLAAHLADALELPLASITPTSSMLGDLHLNSLQVAQAVAAVATALGRALPEAPLSLAGATVGEAAEVLAALPVAEEATDAPAVAGVADWVRAFATTWEPFAGGSAPVVRWSVRAPVGHWLHELPAAGGAPGLAVLLSAADGPDEVAAVLREVAGSVPAHLLVVHAGHPAAAAVARSAVAELGCAAVVVDVPEEAHRLDPAVLADAVGSRYLELRVTGGGLERAGTAVVALGAGGERPGAAVAEPHPHLRPGDVCLVTGGVRGITAYCAADLAERTGAVLVLTGRSDPDDPAVLAALADLRARVAAHYVRCDLGDPAQVRTAVAAAREHGPLRGLLHGAAVNEPRRMAEVDATTLRAVLAPKVTGLRALLDEAGDDLALLVGFGSIIGRQGLEGQAEYCVANDWLRVDVEAWAAANPDRRAHVVEWSVWSGIGMGVRLDVLDSLRRRGVEPIGPRTGAAALADVLAAPTAPVTVLVSSRFPAGPTLDPAGPAVPWLRFDEHRLTRTAGVEAVVDAAVGTGTDPYLAEHRVAGSPVLPAVVGLEAMAQAALLAGGAPDGPWEMSDVRFREPVVVDDARGAVLRLAALVEGGGTRVVLRQDIDRFGHDRFLATAARAAPPPDPRPAEAPPVPGRDPHPWYDRLLFHRGRFRRLLRHDVLSAFRLEAWVTADDAAGWFSAFHSARLLLGDPGAHDATLHALLACVPHRRALPVGVDRVSFWRRPDGPLRVRARETAHTADEYVFDVDLTAPDGAAVARWSGLRLRAVGSLPWPDGMPRELVGPWLSRRLIECDLADGVELVTADGPSTAAATAVTGARTWHDQAGALRVADREASASRTGGEGRLLLALADRPVGVDWQDVPAGPVPLHDDDLRTAGLLADKLGEDTATAATRVWAAREALLKLGAAARTPLRVDHATEDGLAVARSGDAVVVTASVRVLGAGGPTAVAVALGEGR